MTSTITKWRTFTGAEYDNVRQIPCATIANGYLIDANGEPIAEDHPMIRAEIERRGRDIYRDHGYGAGHEVPGWGRIPVFGCDHTATTCIEHGCTVEMEEIGYCEQHEAAVAALEQIPADECPGCRTNLGDNTGYFCAACMDAASKSF